MTKKKHWCFVIFVLFLSWSFISELEPKAKNSNSQLVYVIPVEEEIEKGLAAFIKRSIKQAKADNADHIIFNVNTPGGAVDAAADIGQIIRDTKIPTTAFVNKEAISAGAFISLNADNIAMVPTGTIGSAAVIDQTGNAAGKKAESYWRAKMKGAAEVNGRDPIYALAMVDDQIDLPKYGAGKGELLTLTAQQAEEVGYSEVTVTDLQELLDFLNLGKAEIKRTEVTFAEKLARLITHPVIVPILLSIGSLGLVLELYTPGFGIPGIMGAASLILFFYGHLVAGLAGMESIILLVAGIIMILLELFLPGGILGLLGFVSIIASLLLTGDDLGYMGLSVSIALIITIIGSIIFYKLFGLKGGFFKNIILSDSTSTEKGYVSNRTRTELVGKEGMTITPLRPSGTALFSDERIDVVTEGGFIDRNKRVKIVKTEGSRIIVREITIKGLNEEDK